MDFQIWLAFVAASIILLVIPGPTILMVTSFTLSRGRGILLPAIAGVALGDLIAMSLALLGVGALLATSTFLFTTIKWIGAAYLIYLAIKLFRAPPMNISPALEEEVSSTNNTDNKRVFIDCFLTTVFNPKSLIFFTSFLPQFISAENALAPQFLIMIITFVGLAILNAWIWGEVLSMVKSRFKNNQIIRNLHKVGAVMLAGLGFSTLFIKMREL
jgi:threonine/homoserine/homoserine lactone efflux protein